MGAPARAMRSIWATQAAMSRVSVLVIDCTATGCVPPIVQAPMRTSCVARRRYWSIIFFRFYDTKLGNYS